MIKLNQRVKIKNLKHIEHFHEEKGFVTSIHKVLKGNLCYVSLDTHPTTLPFYETELEEIK